MTADSTAAVVYYDANGREVWRVVGHQTMSPVYNHSPHAKAWGKQFGIIAPDGQKT